MTDRFDVCWPFTLAQECPLPSDWSNPHNFSNDAHDPGGETMCGIIQREYDAYRKHKGLPVQDVRHLTRDEGHDIYYNSYWLPECPKLVPGVDMVFFDEAVNAGPSAAIKMLQRALGISVDGIWGDETEKAAAAISNSTTVVKAFTAARETYYRASSGFRYFGHGWINRSETIEAIALKMANP